MSQVCKAGKHLSVKSEISKLVQKRTREFGLDRISSTVGKRAQVQRDEEKLRLLEHRQLRTNRERERRLVQTQAQNLSEGNVGLEGHE